MEADSVEWRGLQNSMKDRTVIVTGASTGIGRAIAVAMANAGAHVAIHYWSSREAAEEVAASCDKDRDDDRKSILVQGDLRDADDTMRSIEAAAQGLGGRVDVLVNNAGSLVRRASIEQMDEQLWREVIDLNFSSVFHATKAALPYLPHGASVLNVSSIAAHTGGGPGAFAYAASKGGVISLTRGLARELADRGIRVNAISPGTIDTPFHQRFNTPEGLEKTRESILLGRLGTPEDCASAAMFLVSPRSGFLTGVVLDVNGGQRFA